MGASNMVGDDKWFVDQSVATPAAFAQLQQTAIQMLAQNTIAMVKGNFSSREVKGKRYWYYRPEDLRTAWDDALHRGPGWRKRLLEGQGASNVYFPGNFLSRWQDDISVENRAKPTPVRPRWLT